MKKINQLNPVFLLIISLLLVQACNTDNEASEPNVVGTWNVGQVNTDLTVDGGTLAVYLRFQADYELAEALMYERTYRESYISIFEDRELEFKSDNTFNGKIPGQENSTGTWFSNSDNTILTFNGELDEETEVIINTLTSKAMEITAKEEILIDLNNDGIDEILLAETTLSLSK